MASCRVRVLLDEPTRDHRVGDSVRGTLEVQVEQPVKADAVEVVLFWRTHGRGNRAQGREQRTSLSSGALEPGSHAFPFEVTIPEGPESYHGELLNIDWYVRGQVDVPWAIDPKGEAELRVVADAARPAPEPHEDDELDTSGRLPPWVLVMFGLALASGTVWLALQDIATGARWLIGLVAGTVALVITWMGVARFLVAQRLGDVQVVLEGVRVMPGGVLRGHLRARPRGRVEIEGATVTLRCMEKVVRGHGTDRSTHTHKLYERIETVCGHQDLRPPARLDEAFEVTVPDDAPLSVKLKDNELNWELEVEVVLPGWPDWSHEFDVQVC